MLCDVKPVLLHQLVLQYRLLCDVRPVLLHCNTSNYAMYILSYYFNLFCDMSYLMYNLSYYINLYCNLGCYVILLILHELVFINDVTLVDGFVYQPPPHLKVFKNMHCSVYVLIAFCLTGYFILLFFNCLGFSLPHQIMSRHYNPCQ